MNLLVPKLGTCRKGPSPAEFRTAGDTCSIGPLHSVLHFDVAALEVASDNKVLLLPPNRSVIGNAVVFVFPKRRRLGGSLRPC